MQPLADFPHEAAQRLVGVFTDIDDTMTTDGRLPAAAYSALERLHDAGLAVVPITGRPAGWCDMIARLWPVAGVVGENGAFTFCYDRASRTMRRRFVTDEATRRHDRARLAALAETILAEVPGCAVASDQLYREADLAIDFAEDVPRLPAGAVDRIVQLFEDAGATAKISSIHVNGWFGRYDKLTTARLFAAEHLGHDLDRDEALFSFCGDSPNDSPMFGFFSHACGVANVRDYRPPAITHPAFVASGRGADGFVEIVDTILAGRATAPRSSERSSSWPA
jgi:HAD superfamily hydrolase (TIGR01484 family)